MTIQRMTRERLEVLRAKGRRARPYVAECAIEIEALRKERSALQDALGVLLAACETAGWDVTDLRKVLDEVAS